MRVISIYSGVLLLSTITLDACDEECVKQYCMFQIVEADNKMDERAESDEYYYQKGKRDAYQDVLKFVKAN